MYVNRCRKEEDPILADPILGAEEFNVYLLASHAVPIGKDIIIAIVNTNRALVSLVLVIGSPGIHLISVL